MAKYFIDLDDGGAFILGNEEGWGNNPYKWGEIYREVVENEGMDAADTLLSHAAFLLFSLPKLYVDLKLGKIRTPQHLYCCVYDNDTGNSCSFNHLLFEGNMPAEKAYDILRTIPTQGRFSFNVCKELKEVKPPMSVCSDQDKYNAFIDKRDAFKPGSMGYYQGKYGNEELLKNWFIHEFLLRLQDERQDKPLSMDLYHDVYQKTANQDSEVERVIPLTCLKEELIQSDLTRFWYYADELFDVLGVPELSQEIKKIKDNLANQAQRKERYEMAVSFMNEHNPEVVQPLNGVLAELNFTFIDTDANKEIKKTEAIVLPKDIFGDTSLTNLEKVFDKMADFLEFSPWNTHEIPGHVSLKNHQGQELSKIIFVRPNDKNEFSPIDIENELSGNVSQYDLNSRHFVYIADNLKHIQERLFLPTKVCPHGLPAQDTRSDGNHLGK